MSESKFEGFEPANTTPVPDIFFDEIMTELTLAETRVLLYIIRRTYGFKKKVDGISLSQFEHGITTKEGKVLDKGVNLHRSVICRTLKSLEEKGYIEKTLRKSRKGDSDPTLYSIKFKQPIHDGGSRAEETTLVAQKRLQGSRSEETGVVAQKRPTRNSKQETVKQETDRQESMRSRAASLECANAPTLSPSSSSEKKTKYIPLDSLNETERAFWEMWCEVSFNKDIPPKLNETAYEHVKKLSPHIGTSEQMESLIECARETLKGKTIYLGNLANCYPMWKQTCTTSGRQRRHLDPEVQKAMDEYLSQQEQSYQHLHERAERKRAKRAAQSVSTIY